MKTKSSVKQCPHHRLPDKLQRTLKQYHRRKFWSTMHHKCRTSIRRLQAALSTRLLQEVKTICYNCHTRQIFISEENFQCYRNDSKNSRRHFVERLPHVVFRQQWPRVRLWDKKKNPIKIGLANSNRDLFCHQFCLFYFFEKIAVYFA